MKTLYALLIGIDHYDGNLPPLKRAVSDIYSVQDFLRRKIAPGWGIDIRALTDRSATRSSVISAIKSQLGKAGNGDVALLYFAGHGSFIAAPDELFRRAEGDQYLESILCYDSRAGAHDLADKELSQLIWEVTQGKNVHMAVIFDSCHSGDATRSLDAGPQFRAVDPMLSPRPAHQFYGYSAGGSYPQRGPHVFLSACGSGEKAFDGAFTSWLLQVLNSGNIRTYSDVLNGVRSAMKREGLMQQPELSGTLSGYQQAPFLGGAVTV